MKKLNYAAAVLVAATLLLVLVLTVRQIATGGGKTVTDAATAPPPSETSEVSPPNADTTADIPAIIDDAQDTPSPEAVVVPPADGQRVILTAPYGRENLSVIADLDKYTHMQQEMGDVFFDKSDESREIFVEIVFMEGDIDFYKAAFLEGYMQGEKETTFHGQIRAAASNVVGEGISIANTERCVDAWLIPVERGFFAVVAGYFTPEQGTELYNLISTLELD